MTQKSRLDNEEQNSHSLCLWNKSFKDDKLFYQHIFLEVNRYWFMMRAFFRSRDHRTCRILPVNIGYCLICIADFLGSPCSIFVQSSWSSREPVMVPDCASPEGKGSSKHEWAWAGLHEKLSEAFGFVQSVCNVWCYVLISLLFVGCIDYTQPALVSLPPPLWSARGAPLWAHGALMLFCLSWEFCCSGSHSS